jgi:hypothetical protein
MWIGDVDFDQVNFKELEQLMHGSKIVRAKLGVMPKK